MWRGQAIEKQTYCIKWREREKRLVSGVENERAPSKRSGSEAAEREPKL